MPDVRAASILPLALGVLWVCPTGAQPSIEPIGSAEHWSDGFAPRGFSIPEWECTSFPDGASAAAVRGDSVIVAGDFTHVEGIAAAGVAIWDGERWSGLGAEPPPLVRVRDVAVFEGRIVVSGISEAGASPLVAWNGVDWEPLGSLRESGSTADIEVLFLHEGRLLAGGYIDTGNGAADLVLAWDGEGWTSLLSATGRNPSVRTLAEIDGRLYAGGHFEIIAGNDTLAGLVRWEGTHWSGFPGITSASYVDAVASFEGRLIVGGSLNFPDDDWWFRYWAAAWEETGWEKLTDGYFTGFGGISAERFLVRDGRLWAFGNYWSDIGGSPMLARWTGEGWVEERPAMGSCGGGWGPGGGSFTDLEAYGDGYVVTGAFLIVEGEFVGHVALWEGDTWSPLGVGGNGLDGHVRALLADGDGIWVGGNFLQSGSGQRLPRLARWSEGSWTTTPTQPDGAVYALGRHAGQLVVAGRFDSVGALPTANLALWDGHAWTPFDEGPEGGIAAVVDFRGDLIAAGGFTYAGGTPVHNIARWDGTAWSRMQTGLLGDARWEGASHLTIYRDELIAAGSFYSAGRQLVRSIAAWDGESWHGLGTPPWPEREVLIEGLTVWDGRLVAAATSYRNGESFLAAWDGSTWSSLDGVELNSYGELSTYRGFLVVTGNSGQHNGAWLWDGTTLYALGENIGSDWVSALETWNDDLALGGAIRYAGGRPSRNVAVYHGAGLPTHLSPLQLSIAPNPSHDGGLVAFSLDRAADARLSVFDVQGRRRRILVRDRMPAGDHWISWDGRDDAGSRLPVGTYFLRLDAAGNEQVRKIQILR